MAIKYRIVVKERTRNDGEVTNLEYYPQYYSGWISGWKPLNYGCPCRSEESAKFFINSHQLEFSAATTKEILEVE